MSRSDDWANWHRSASEALLAACRTDVLGEINVLATRAKEDGERALNYSLSNSQETVTKALLAAADTILAEFW